MAFERTYMMEQTINPSRNETSLDQFYDSNLMLSKSKMGDSKEDTSIFSVSEPYKDEKPISKKLDIGQLLDQGSKFVKEAKRPNTQSNAFASPPSGVVYDYGTLKRRNLPVKPINIRRVNNRNYNQAKTILENSARSTLSGRAKQNEDSNSISNYQGYLPRAHTRNKSVQPFRTPAVSRPMTHASEMSGHILFQSNKIDNLKKQLKNY